MKTEAIELTITACEKFSQNYEVHTLHYDYMSSKFLLIMRIASYQQAAKLVKESMDKKFGTFWHVVIGEGFGFEVSFETKNMLYLFFAGNLAIVLWKCS